MTTIDTLKAAVAIALSAAAGLAVAQQGGNANSASSAVSSSPSPSDDTVRAPGYDSTYPALYDNIRMACAGLADRQTERACKQDYRRERADLNPSKRGNDSGNVDDQAD